MKKEAEWEQQVKADLEELLEKAPGTELPVDAAGDAGQQEDQQIPQRTKGHKSSGAMS